MQQPLEGLGGVCGPLVAQQPQAQCPPPLPQVVSGPSSPHPFVGGWYSPAVKGLPLPQKGQSGTNCARGKSLPVSSIGYGLEYWWHCFYYDTSWHLTLWLILMVYIVNKSFLNVVLDKHLCFWSWIVKFLIELITPGGLSFHHGCSTVFLLHKVSFF